ncbi:MAG: sulfatase-like hydrolase/transferase [Planctomycetota bacterium]|nr:sulfatase-like hydrolase/transferase [Planctomycetota bacterium]
MKLGLGEPQVPVPVEAAKPPNILLVSLDTLRADRLGCYGYDRDTSPLLDRLAGEGTLFLDLSAPSSKTAPSHMTMLSGMHPGVHGVRNCYTVESQAASADLPLLPELLAEVGYRTAAFTGGGMLSGELGFERGFEVYDEAGGGAERVLPKAGAWLRDYAATEGAKDDPAPFFLFVHTYEIHDPYTPPKEWQQRFAAGYQGGIDSTRIEYPLDAAEAWKTDPGFYDAIQARFWGGMRPTPEDVQHLSNLYDAGIGYTDSVLAELWRTVEELDLDEELLLVVTSDHGEEFNEHGKLTHKTIYQPVLHVPLIVRWPGRVEAGAGVAAPVQGADLAPSLLELAGLTPEPVMQGRSWVPKLRSGDGAPVPVDLVWSELGTPDNEEAALRWGRYKLIGHRAAKTLAVYDLEVDPGEKVDAAGMLTEVTGVLTERLMEQETANGTLAPGFRTQPVTLGGAAQGMIDALGYTGD